MQARVDYTSQSLQVMTSVKTADSDPHDHGIAASATCQDNDCTQLAFKVMQLLPVHVH